MDPGGGCDLIGCSHKTSRALTTTTRVLRAHGGNRRRRTGTPSGLGGSSRKRFKCSRLKVAPPQGISRAEACVGLRARGLGPWDWARSALPQDSWQAGRWRRSQGACTHSSWKSARRARQLKKSSPAGCAPLQSPSRPSWGEALCGRGACQSPWRLHVEMSQGSGEVSMGGGWPAGCFVQATGGLPTRQSECCQPRQAHGLGSMQVQEQ